jgi:hypothetical protein
MGRAKRLGAGTRSAGLAIEYVRTRKVVRLLGWLYDEPIEPVEIPVAELSQRLGIDPRDLGASCHYLLFAGSHRHPAGGLRDLVGTFDSEDQAFAAFQALRAAHPSTQGWAELAAIDGMGQVNQLAWFGLHPATEPDDDASGTGIRPVHASPQDRRYSFRRLLASGGESRNYLRAVTPS